MTQTAAGLPRLVVSMEYRLGTGCDVIVLTHQYGSTSAGPSGGRVPVQSNPRDSFEMLYQILELGCERVRVSHYPCQISL